MSVKEKFAATTASSVKLATDQASLVALQTLIAGDTTTVTTADQALSDELKPLPRPSVIVNDDGTFTILVYATTPPFYSVTIGDPAS